MPFVKPKTDVDKVSAFFRDSVVIPERTLAFCLENHKSYHAQPDVCTCSHLYIYQKKKIESNPITTWRTRYSEFKKFSTANERSYIPLLRILRIFCRKNLVWLGLRMTVAEEQNLNVDVLWERPRVPSKSVHNRVGRIERFLGFGMVTKRESRSLATTERQFTKIKAQK